MDEISSENSKNIQLDNNGERHQDIVENDASDYESINSNNEDNNGKVHKSDDESDTLENIEREEGDGQESIPPKKVDDDEDKKNPQYIPKRGTFYEHDDRTVEEEEEEGSGSDKKDRQSKKSIWIEKKEQWGHDRYNENEQVPKSRSELIGIYGYDIRNEDGPPRARRRRRYGRGPNKYTRTWEDEDAYKPAKPVKALPKKSKNNEEFPPLDPTNDDENEVEAEERPTKPVEDDVNRAWNNNNNSITNLAETQPKIEEAMLKDSESKSPAKPPQQEIKPTDYRGFTKARQYKNTHIVQKVVKKPENPLVANNLEEDLANLSITKKQNRQSSIPPRLQSEQKVPKRYSSLRQRSLPETAAPTTFNQHTYYANDYTPPQPQQAILSQPPPASVLQQISTNIQQVPVTGTALLPTPTQFAPAFPPAPGFIPVTVSGTPFISPPPPQIINYVPSPPQFAQPPFQGFPQQFNTVTPPTELYQFQGGTTYYSTQNQHLGHLPLQPRPKAAIPIVPPPLQEPTPGVDVNGYDDFYETEHEDATIVVQ